jgi:hypothetical protein
MNPGDVLEVMSDRKNNDSQRAIETDFEVVQIVA